LKKTVFILLIIFGYVSIYGQELNGVWLEYNNRVIDPYNGYTSGGEGLIIDFDNSTLSHLQSDSLFNFKASINNKKAKIKIKGIKGRLKLKIFGCDSLEIDSKENMVRVFRKLDLSNKINFTKKEIANFLTTHKFDSIQGFKGEFSADQFNRDRNLERPHTRNKFINKNWDEQGYWYIKKVKESALLIFTVGQTEINNILQILMINENGLKLKPLQNDEWFENLTEINTILK